MDSKESNNQYKYSNFLNQRKVMITSVFMKVKFPCRLFMQYPLNKLIKRTKQIKVDSKKQSYEYNQIIIWNRFSQNLAANQSNDLKITVKLLSNRGFEFIAGSFILQEKDFENKYHKFSYKISKTSDVDAQCFCEILQSDSTLQQKHFLKQIKEQIQQNSKSDNEQQLVYKKKRQETNIILPQQSKMQEKSNVDLVKEIKVQKLSDFKAYTSNKSNRSENKLKRQQYSSQSFFQSRYKTLERQLDYHSQLFQKQKSMINLIEQKYKQSIQQQEKLRVNLYKYETELEEKRKIIDRLENDKINLLTDHLKNDKKLSQFKESMKNLLEKMLRQISKTFSQKYKIQKESLGFKITNSLTKNNLLEPKTPVQMLNIDGVEQQSEALSDSYNFPDLSELNEPSNENIEKNISNGLSRSVGLAKNGFSSKSNSPPNNEVGIKLSKNKIDNIELETNLQFDQCLQILKCYKTKIIQKVAQNANKISNKLTQLGQSNKIFRLKLKQNRQEFQNNQQALFQHLEQLQQGLQRQLQITEQKDQAIFGYLTMIEDLSEKIEQLSNKITVLEEQNTKLQQQKTFIKGELHQNNYMFSLKQQDYIKRIQILQNSTSLLSNNKHFAHLIRNKQENISSQYSDRENDDYQSSLNEYCQRLRDKEIELIREKKQKQNLMQQLSVKQQQLQFAIMSKKKLEFAIKLKQKLSNEQLHRSFDLDQDEQQQKKIHMQQQFLKVLI